MRHVSTAELHANAVEVNAAIRAGDQVTVMVDGQEYRLVPARSGLIRRDSQAVVDRRRAALEDLRHFRAELRAKGMQVTSRDVRGWIDEGRP